MSVLNVKTNVPADEDRVPLNNAEFMLVERLGLANYQLEKCCTKEMEARLRALPNAWRDWRLLTSTSSRLIDKLLDTIPSKQLQRIAHIFEHGEVLIRERSFVRSPQLITMPLDDLAFITEAAIKAQCRHCLRSGKEVKRCKLYRALIGAAPPENLRAMAAAIRRSRKDSLRMMTCEYL